MAVASLRALCSVVRRLAGASLCAAAATAGCVAPDGAAGPPLATVSAFDPDRYLGRWHEVARLPNSFQRDCAGEVTADYTEMPDGLIRVVNTCRDRDGRWETAEGWARATGDDDNGKLEVTFLGIFGRPIWLAAGDYWVIGLDRDYRWAIVGAPDRQYGWILARGPTLDRPTLVYLARLVDEKGYEFVRLRPLRYRRRTGPAAPMRSVRGNAFALRRRLRMIRP